MIQNFEITKEGLLKCRSCETTFESELECQRHQEGD